MLKLYNEDGIFYPTQYGLGAGDTVDIVLVAAGNASGSVNSAGGSVGQNSSFGSYAIAYAGMGAKGAPANVNSGAGGGGGYVPGSPWQGGTGLSTNVAAATTPIATPCTNGGGASSTYQTLFAGDGSSCGGGNSIGGNSTGMGGNGYGAGGGIANATGYYGGTAGQILYYSHIITADDVANGIPITVGCAPGTTAGIYATNYTSETGTTFTTNIYPKTSGTLTTGLIQGVPTFSLVDGSFGFAKGKNTSSGVDLTTTHIKLYNTGRYVPITTAFPGCVTGASSFRYPFYYCNGYYIQVVGSNTGTTVYTWNATKVKDGTITEADKGTVTYGTVATPVGFDDTKMIVYVDATHIKVYTNWTPESTTYTTTTLNAAIAWKNAAGTVGITAYSHFVPYSTDCFLTVTFDLCTGATVNTAAGAARQILSTSTGATTSSTQTDVILYYIGASAYYCYTHYSVAVVFDYGSIFTNPTTNAFCFYIAKGSTVYTFGGLNTAGEGPTVKCIMGTKGFAVGNNARSTAMPGMYGYAGQPGVSTAGGVCGGAGGCCMITW